MPVRHRKIEFYVSKHILFIDNQRRAYKRNTIKDKTHSVFFVATLRLSYEGEVRRSLSLIVSGFQECMKDKWHHIIEAEEHRDTCLSIINSCRVLLP